MINGVVLTSLTQIVDERGKIMHMLKASDPMFKNFGEIYFSWAWPGSIKGWHVHKRMTLNLAVISGRALFQCYDMRSESTTFREVNRFHLGIECHNLLTIPPGVASGYAPYSDEKVIVANCATEPHDKLEIEYFEYDMFPRTVNKCNWLVTHG